jgi:hypothetical protein
MSNYDAALHAAIDRDLRDAERLSHIAGLVTGWLDQLIPELEAGAIEHPRSRWHPEDLVDVLQDQLRSIRWEQGNLTGPVVVEEV